MNYSKELIETVKSKNWLVTEYIKKENFVRERISPLAEELGYGIAVYSMMFLDGEYYGEMVKVYDKNLNLDFMIDVSVDSPAAIISDCASVCCGIKKKLYLTNFVAKHSVEFISGRELKNILEENKMANLIRTRSSLYIDVKRELNWMNEKGDEANIDDSYDYIRRIFDEDVRSNDGSISKEEVHQIEELLENQQLPWDDALFEILKILED